VTPCACYYPWIAIIIMGVTAVVVVMSFLRFLSVSLEARLL
jgi:hypothetical protein